MSEKKEPTLRDYCQHLIDSNQGVYRASIIDFIADFDKEHNPEPEKLVAGEVYEDGDGERFWCNENDGFIYLDDKDGDTKKTDGYIPKGFKKLEIK